MRFSFEFSNLLGTVYTKGNTIFTPDGNTLLSPVGNRVTAFNLVEHTSVTLPFENRMNIQRIALSPDGRFLVTVDEEGKSLFINYPKRVVLHHFSFKKKVEDLQFSPDGKYFAVTSGRHVQVWQTPPLRRETGAFVLHRTYTGHYDDVTCIDWSADSRFFCAGSKDMTTRVYSLHPIKGFHPLTLSGHRDLVVACQFAKDNKVIYSLGRDGSLCIWEWELLEIKKEEEEDGVSAMETITTPSTSESNGRFRLAEKKFVNAPGGVKISSGVLHKRSQLFVIGRSDGVFALYEMPSFSQVHSLSISEHKVTACAINSTGEWLAFGSAKLGQLLVWEWQSETYVLKQQGHYYDMSSIAYSPDSRTLVTAGDDGKVKVWNTASGYCFVTFDDHKSGVTGVTFAPNGTAIISCSLDGTVRAFDTIRYRNFRTLTTPTPVQFSCVCVDPAGEIVCAGTRDPFSVCVWALQTGKLLDMLQGHEGPISGIAFSPTEPILATCSWDKTVRLWDVFEGKGNTETVQTNSDVLTVAFRPDGKQLVCSLLNGEIMFWDLSEGKLVATIEGRRDIAGGRSSTDRRTAANTSAGKAFTTLAYSADGQYLIAGGSSKYICIYDVSQQLMIKKYQISHNRSLDGILDFLDSRKMTDAGPQDELDVESDEDVAETVDKKNALPGVGKGDLSTRKTNRAIRTTSVKFAPTGRSFAASTTEGLLIYSLDEHLSFDPFELEMHITPVSIRAAVAKEEFAKAIMLCLRLNEKEIVEEVFDAVPHGEIALVVQTLPTPYIRRLTTHIGKQIETSTRLEFYMKWALSLLSFRARFFQENASQFASVFRALQKSILLHQEALAQLSYDNTFNMQYITNLSQLHARDEPAVTDGPDDKEQLASNVNDGVEDMEGLASNFSDDEPSTTAAPAAKKTDKKKSAPVKKKTHSRDEEKQVEAQYEVVKEEEEDQTEEKPKKKSKTKSKSK